MKNILDIEIVGIEAFHTDDGLMGCVKAKGYLRVSINNNHYVEDDGKKEKEKIKMIKTPVIGCLSIEGSQLYVFPILEK